MAARQALAAARRKPVNVSVQARLIDEARTAGLNLSRVLEEALDSRLRESRIARWREENRAAIEEFNAYIEKYGCFSDEYRSF